MLFPSKHIHKDFTNSLFWVPDLKWSSQVVRNRRYRVIHQDSAITIERTFNDVFDLLGSEVFKRWWCIAEGKIEWQENKASVNLEVRLVHLMEILLIFIAVISGLGFLFLLYIDWQVGLVFGLIMALTSLINFWVISLRLRQFHSELELDMEYFKAICTEN